MVRKGHLPYNRELAQNRQLEILREAGEPKSIAWLQKQEGYSFRAMRELEAEGKIIVFDSADGEDTLIRLPQKFASDKKNEKKELGLGVLFEGLGDLIK